MDFFGLIWAVYLPNQSLVPTRQAAFYQDFAVIQVIPGGEGLTDIVTSDTFAPEQTNPSDGGTTEVTSGATYRADKPADVAVFAPQLQRMENDTVDWDYWSAFSTVTISKDDEVKHSVPPINACPAVKRTLPQFNPAGTAPKAGDAAASTASYTLEINDVAVGTVPSQAAAETMASQLRRSLPQLKAQAADLQPLLGDDFIGGGIQGQSVVELTPALAQTAVKSSDPAAALVAANWVNNLRQAFGKPTLALADLQMLADGLRETSRTLNGVASWYGPYFHGRQTATGEIFDQHELTAAHPSLPFGTYLKVRNLNNDRTVVVRVNDRGPYIGERSLDLSYAAARCLGSEIVGVIPYEATILTPGVPQRWQAETVTAQR